MRVGDLLEWLAACAFVGAGWLGASLPVGLLVAGVCLAYFAQCHAEDPIRLPALKAPTLRLPWRKGEPA